MLAIILGLVGVLGVGGVAALAVFGPPAVMAFGKVAIEVVSDILSRIVATRVGCASLAAVACLLFGYFVFDDRGAARVQAKWDTAKIEAAEKVRNADAEAARRAKVAEDRATAAEEKADVAEEKARNAYLKNLPKSNVCTDTADDIKRLQRIR
jgi:hypothetical protein